MRRLIRGQVIGLFLGVLAASPAVASPILLSRVVVSATVPNSTQRDDTGYVKGDDAGPAVATAIAAFPFAGTATSTGAVLNAELHAEASAASVGSSTVSANVQEYFSDTFVLRSSSRPPGTLVWLKLGIDPSYSISARGCFGDHGLGVFQLSASVQIDDPVAGPPERDTLGRLDYSDSSCRDGSVPVDLNKSTSLQAPIGQDLYLVANLFLSVWAERGQTASVDASNTVRLLLDPPSDVTYSTVSGNSYRSPGVVAEPTALVLLSVGVAAARRRFRPSDTHATEER